MAYPCPHCGQNAKRSPSAGGWESGGLLGWILCSAMADFDCPRCGKILREEFPPEVQQQMASGTYTMVAVGAVLAMASMVVALMIHFMR
jgi:predicted RNA-binding Zn-ribbon protein involved in translation (DUF1610 family)